MNVFRSLRDYLKWLAGRDEPAEPAPEKKQPEVRPVVRPVQRAASSQGDGFDAGPRGSRVDLRGGFKVPVLEAEEPRPIDAAFAPTDFNASLEDVPVLVDEPMGEQTEFIPEGGMSTQSLMQEFETLDPVVVAESIALTVSAIEPMTTAPTDAAPTAPAADLSPAPAAEFALPAGEAAAPRRAALEEFSTADLLAPDLSAPSSEIALPAPDVVASTEAAAESPGLGVVPAAVDSAEFATPDSTFAFADSSLAESAFESDPADSVAHESAPSSFEESSFTPADPSRAPVLKQPERMTPAWLIPATTAAAPKAAPTGPEFSASLDDLGLASAQPPLEPAAPEGQPSPPRGEGES